MNLNFPDVVTGRAIPHSVQKQILKEEEEKELRKKQRRHDYAVAIVGAIVGAVATNYDRIIGFIKGLVS